MAECLDALIPHDGSIEAQAAVFRVAKLLNSLQRALTRR